jgi:hypothetical protein
MSYLAHNLFSEVMCDPHVKKFEEPCYVAINYKMVNEL